MTALSEIVPLKHALAHKPREPALPFLARNAVHQGCSNPRDFCLDYGISVTEVAQGKVAAITQLAVLCNVDANELRRWSPTRVSERFFTLNGELLGSMHSPKKVLRGCPLCMLEDIEAADEGVPQEVAVYTRAEHLVGYIQTCDKHNVALVEVRRPTTHDEWVDPAKGVNQLLDAIEEQPLVYRSPTAFEDECLNRVLDRPSRAPALAPFSLVTLAKACRALGADILTAEAENKAAAEDDRLCMEAGFDAVKNGEASLIPVLKHLRGATWTKYDLAARAIPNLIKNLRSMFGTGEGEAMADLIAGAAFKVFPYAEGDTFLDVVCNKRYLHTLPTASRAYPMPPRVMELFLENTPGLVVAGSLKEGKVLIDATMADELFQDRVPLIPMNQVAVMTGVKWDAVRELLDCGLLQDERDPQLEQYTTLFSLPRVEAFLADFYLGWKAVEAPSPGRVSLFTAVNRIRSQRPKFFEFIARGELSVEYLANKPPMGSIHIDIDEAYRLFYMSPNPISAEEAGKMMLVNEMSVRRMIEAGYLTNLHDKAKVNGCRFAFRVEQAEVKEFMSRFASLGEFVKRYGAVADNAVKLAKFGYSPAVDLGARSAPNCTATFYRRGVLDEVAKHLS
ncbi:TniQ family protein [Devosia naphthalenivorans]|uniref:TniQ family protein n=1 Tax=Devosia naphthalenivorans TaxID=2082392 RepID=UPI000D366F57|nr:TniQ family protein [Devosia naphthalenivorans]